MQPNKPQIEHLALDALVPYARNSRTHSAEQVAQIAGSIREFGFTNPVLIDADGGIIAGHGRVMAARKLGLDEVPCIRLTHLTETQKRAYIIADNKLALNAGWDEEMLRLELGELREADVDLSLVGFTEEEIDGLLAPPPDFAPGTEGDQGKLDELAPKMVKCPTCNHVFNSRGHEQD
jgi:ParB-like chromosome segregation protein Spo0J